MDSDLKKMLEENHALLIENVKISRENQKKIKKIQLHIRRTMVVKTLYWIIIVGVTIGAFYLSKPYINNAVNTYKGLEKNIKQSSQIINDPGTLFKDVNIIERFLGS